jgi:hypothetical protein
MLRLRLALSKGGVSAPHLRTESNPVSETSCSLGFRIPDDGQSPEKNGSEFGLDVLFLEPAYGDKTEFIY